MHTADNHIGMKFSNKEYPQKVKEKLLEERLNALKRIVDNANETHCHFLVIAGDLFDSVNVKSGDIKATVKILNSFAGEAVLIVPGNHDFFESSSGTLWDKFHKEADEQKLFILSEYAPQEFNIKDQKLVFFPACCKSKHSEENMIGWVAKETLEPEAINIGIAHGNVEGMGLDEREKYFNMKPQELKDSKLDFWLLGHIHVPYPKTSVSTNPGYFMPATHTPDGWDRKHGGYCWLIEVDEKKSIKADLIETGSIKFFDLKWQLNSLDDFEKLVMELNSLDKLNSMLRIELNGRLKMEDLAKARNKLQQLNDEFLFFQSNDLLNEYIDQAYINALYPNDSIPHQLLSSLISADDDGLALQLANELIEKSKL